MTVDRETVHLAYQLLLGREPENEQVIDNFLPVSDAFALGSLFRNSHEFTTQYLPTFHESKWVATEVLDRFVQWVDLRDRYVSRGCLTGGWEANETSYFEARLNTGDTVLDIGANIGWFSLVAAKHIGPHGVVHAFEPRPETNRMLKRTIVDNRLQSVIHLWPYALSDQPALLDLMWAPVGDNPGGSHLRGEGEPGGQVFAKVLAVRLDDLLPDIAPDIVKIDIEGAEPMALAGAVNALSRKHPPILSELHVHQLRVLAGRSPREYISQLGDLGYACYLLEDGRPTQRLHDFPPGHGGLVSVVFEWRAGLIE